MWVFIVQYATVWETFGLDFYHPDGVNNKLSYVF